MKLLATIATAILLSTTATMADGAIAEGYTGNVNRDGYAIGYSWNYNTPDEARAEAIKQCRTATDSGAQKSCRVVATVRNQCMAGAIDPKDGTPGVGWAVAATEEEAKDQAMANCRSTAGNRARFCEVSFARCDGTAAK